MPDPARQRAFALEIAQKLRAAGFEALWAGGCVRDELLGLTPKDYDVATSATPDQIRDLFGHRRTLPIAPPSPIAATTFHRSARSVAKSASDIATPAATETAACQCMWVPSSRWTTSW